MRLLVLMGRVVGGSSGELGRERMSNMILKQGLSKQIV